LKFFVDACISPKLARAIKALDDSDEIVHLHDRFPQGTTDARWLGELGRERDWVVVSADPRISRGSAERAAWKDAGLTAFFFASGFTNMKIWKQAETLVRCWPLMRAQARLAAPGSGFLVPIQGNKLKPIIGP
jgi:hypothetical protein